jgi:hypothetical protein
VAWFAELSPLRGVLTFSGKQSMEYGQNKSALNRSQIRVEHRACDVEGCRAHDESSCHGTGKAQNRVHHQIASLSCHIFPVSQPATIPSMIQKSNGMTLLESLGQMKNPSIR